MACRIKLTEEGSRSDITGIIIDGFLKAEYIYRG